MGYNWRQRRMRLLLGVAIVACGIALARPAIAGAGWPLEGSGAVLLGFGASYTSTEATSASTHRGIDIAAEKGAEVRAPLAGRVTFAGRIPAAGGGTCRAVTIATDVGAVTLLPLASSRVSKGDTLAEGDAVGALAESGDGSSAGAHLHVGVKRGDLYVDPLTVLLVAAVASGRSSGEAKLGAPASGGQQSEGSQASGRGTRGTRTRAGASAPAATAPLRVPVPGQAVAPGVSVAGDARSSRQVARGQVGATQGSASAASAAAASHPAPQAATSVAEWLQRLAGLALGATKAASLSAFALLMAVGALWPLWRRERRKGLGEDCVSTASDDVAAVVGR